MDKKIHIFLDSGLLEKYLIGDTSKGEAYKVEQYIAKYPEIQEEYNLLQDQLELAAKAQAQTSPDLLDSIMEELDETPVVQLKRHGFPNWMGIAASIVAVMFAVTSYVFYNRNQVLTDENDTIAEEIFDLRSDIDNNNVMLEGVMRQLMKLNNPETQKYVLRGNERAKDLKTVAYINPIDKSSLIDVVSLPKISEEQCYQMWAQIQDRMVNLGILDEADRNLKPIPYVENAVSLSITIEPKGGNTQASMENSVATIPLKIKDN
ncbi:MAG: anti-sigma factor [Bacteroidia bacterium]|nr:anti-sigma factor [Bacteroidia bacterium]MBT8268104.1 anti-sigma factor [Bacteroidia bacterium]NNF82713.1 anti-sigma factor [Flavobacteriaceae bacterium]NNK71321.1 anti-sigma factor [Flavobacteriaceae bacterium]NNL79275.1 anti-sigma factor [Flavobacteriaceae bacterium]